MGKKTTSIPEDENKLLVQTSEKVLCCMICNIQQDSTITALNNRKKLKTLSNGEGGKQVFNKV